MPTLEEKRQEIFDDLVLQPGNVILSRLNTIENAKLSDETMAQIGDAILIDDKQNIAYQLGRQNAIIRGAQEADVLKFNFNTPANYSIPITYTLPTTTAFGFQIIDAIGNEVTLNSTPTDEFYFGNFYLTKDQTGTFGGMVNIDNNLTPYITPNVAGPVNEIIDSGFGTKKLTFTKTLINVPNKKAAPIASIVISLSTVGKIGAIDEFGIVTNTSGNTFIDEDNSFFDWANNEITIVFLTTPAGTDVTLNLAYDYQASNNTVSEEFDGTLISGPSATSTVVGVYDHINFLFKKTLAEVPLLSTLEIFRNDTKIAIANDSTQIYGMTINLSKTTLKGKVVVLSVNGVQNDQGNIIRFDYTIKDTVSTSEQIGGFGLTSITYNQTLSNTTVNIDSLVVKMGTITVATADWQGNISGIYETIDGSGLGTIVGIITGAGVLSLTLIGQSPGDGEIYTPSLESLSVDYEFVGGLSTWLDIWAQLEIDSLSTVAYTGGTLNVINLAASAIDNPPKLYGTYPLKRHQDELEVGKLIVITEGLEINTNWLPIYVKRDGAISLSGEGTELTSAAVLASAFITNQLAGATLRLYDYDGQTAVDYTIESNTGSSIIITYSGGFTAVATSIKFEILFDPEDATKMADIDFKTYLSWMDPDTNDDLIISANSNNVSDAIEDPGNYANIEKNPFRPSTDGEYETQQPGSLTFDDIFAGNFGHIIDADPDQLKWWIHSDLKWIYDPDPQNILDTTTFYTTWETSSAYNPLSTPMAAFRDISFGTDVIPSDGSPYQWILSGTEIQEIGTNGRWACKYNDVQDMLNGQVSSQILALEVLRTELGNVEFIDILGGSAEDALFWAAVEAIAIDLNNLITPHTNWRTQYATHQGDLDTYNKVVTGGNPSVLADTFQTNLGSGGDNFYADLFASGIGRQPTIQNRIGAPTTSGYSKEIYDIMNSAAGRTIGFVTDVISAYLSISATYTHINDQRTKYRFYDNAIED